MLDCALTEAASKPKSEIKPWLFTSVLVLAGYLALLASGADAVDAGKFTGFVSLQVVSGALAWQALNTRRSIPIPELIGMGGAIGFAVEILLGQVLRAQLQSVSALVAPLLLIVTSLALLAVFRRRINRPAGVPLSGFLWVLGSIAIGLASLASFWKRHPLNWTDWWSYHADVIYHLGASQQVARYGPGEQPFFANFSSFRYHWFADSWVGQSSWFLQISDAFALTRGMYVVAVVVGIALAWSWIYSLSKNPVISGLAAFALTSAGVLAVGPKHSASIFIADISPTHTFSIIFMLGLAFAITQFWVSGFPLHLLVPAMLLVVACTGGRISHAICFAAGLISALVYAFIARVRGRLIILLTAVVVFALMFATSRAIGISQTGGSRFTPRTYFAAVYGFVPWAGTSGEVIANASLVVAVLAAWMTAISLVLDRLPHFRIIGYFAIGVAVAGLGGIFFIDNGGSEESFVWSSSVLLFTLSPLGAWRLMRRVGLTRKSDVSQDLTKNRGKPLTTIIVFGLLLGPLLALLVVWTYSWARFGGLVRFALPFAIMLCCLMLSFAIVRHLKSRKRISATLAASLVMILTVSVSMSVTGIPILITDSPSLASINSPLSITEEEVEAGKWLKKNVEPGEIVATTRICNAPSEDIDCTSAFPMVSALSGARVYAEASARALAPNDRDSDSSLPDWARSRLKAQLDFAGSLNPASFEKLWAEGVRWMWIDPRVISRQTWSPFARIAFQNERATILEFNPPGATNPT